MTSHHFSIRKAKLVPPRVAGPLIARPQLTRMLRDGARHALVVLTAEAGYGKTSLLLASLPEIPGPVAWLSLDETDTDPNLFAAALVLALQQVAPGVGEAALDLLTAGPGDAALGAAIGRTFEELPREIALVVDDFHVLDETPESLALVDHLLTRLPSHVHLVIASRTQPALRGLSSLAVRGAARVLTRTDLAFTPEEVTAFLRESHGVSVDAAQASHLADRTEGWPAALQLAALVHRGRGPLGLEGTPREVFDYLAATVLEGLPPDLRRFLLGTSILWELTPALCAAVTGAADAEAILESIERRNLFLYRLDETGSRLRYHQLFAEFLQHRLAREEPELVTSLHVRAGRALEGEGLGDQAVRHYLAAGAYADAVRTLVPYRAGRLTAQRAYTFRDLVRRLPEAVAAGQPWLLRTAASSCRFVGDYAQALTWSRQAAAASEGKDVNLWAHSMHGVAVMLANLGRLREAIATGEDALARLPADVDPKMRADLHLFLATCHRLAGQLDDAHRHVDDGLRLARQTGDLDGVAQGLLNLGWLRLSSFAPVAARAPFEELARWSEDQRSPSYEVAAHAGLAAVAITLGDVAAAATALDRAALLHARVGERSVGLQLGWTRGDLALLRGDLARARHEYEHVLAQCREGESARPRIHAALGLGRVARAEGDRAAAARYAAEALALCRAGDLGSLRPLAALEAALAAAAGGRRRQALALAAESAEILSAWRSVPGLAMCGLVKTHIDCHRGQHPRAPTVARARVAADVAAQRADLRGWLILESRWAIPLLIASRRSTQRSVDDLVLDLGPVSVPPLIAALAEPRVRLGAIRLLGELGDPRARRPLAAWAQRGSPRVRSAAGEALGRLPGPPSADLRVRLFGRFAVERNGAPIEDGSWRTRKAKALVKLLLLHGEAGVHRDQLIEWLWPDRDPRAGGVNLKTAVKLARRALEPHAEGLASHFLRWEGDVLRLDRRRVWVDVEEYARTLDAGHAHRTAGRIDEAIAALERAAALYRGDLLDPDDRYQPWAADARERWRAAQCSVIADLAHLHAARGDHDRASAVLETALAIDATQELVYQDLMRYALRRGRRNEAVALYQRCTQVLRAELGVDPQPATARVLKEAGIPV